jgi:hypothetical protein
MNRGEQGNRQHMAALLALTIQRSIMVVGKNVDLASAACARFDEEMWQEYAALAGVNVPGPETRVEVILMFAELEAARHRIAAPHIARERARIAVMS